MSGLSPDRRLVEAVELPERDFLSGRAVPSRVQEPPQPRPSALSRLHRRGAAASCEPGLSAQRGNAMKINENYACLQESYLFFHRRGQGAPLSRPIPTARSSAWASGTSPDRCARRWSRPWRPPPRWGIRPPFAATAPSRAMTFCARPSPGTTPQRGVALDQQGDFCQRRGQERSGQHPGPVQRG